MMRNVTLRFRRAVRFAAASVKTLAQEAGYAHVTFDKYLNERPPTVPAALALADALERRADQLTKHAGRLREAVDEHVASEGGTTRRRRSRR